jgi:hypothetical protein
METPKEYYYTYYSYEEWGRGYFGSRKCYCLPEEDIKYFGSFYDNTFKPTQKIILKDDYATREEALADEIILHDYYDVANNPHFANQAKQTSTKFVVNREVLIERNKKGKGRKVNDEFRKKMSSVTKGEKNGMYGKKRPDLAERNRKRMGRKIKYSENGLKSKQKSANLVNSQKWECCETGYVSTAAGVVAYQRGKGIDTSKNNRRRIA